MTMVDRTPNGYDRRLIPPDSSSSNPPGVLVPVKRPARSKTRLAGCLHEEARRKLVLALVDHVARTLAELEPDCRVLFVTNSSPVREIVLERGLDCTREPADPEDLADLVDRTVRSTLSECRGTLVLPVDLPLLKSETVGRILRRGRQSPVILVPDRKGGGTNALWRRTTRTVSCGWHGTHSFETHHRRALASGVEFRIMRPPDVTFDLDTPEDWNHLRERCDRLSTPLRDLVRNHANHGA